MYQPIVKQTIAIVMNTVKRESKINLHELQQLITD